MRSYKLVLMGALLATAASASPAIAQDGYMFGMPRATLTLRAGVARPAAEGELFQRFMSDLTLDKDDFASATFGADLGIRIHRQVDFMLSAGFARSSKDSEFRDLVEEVEGNPEGLPIRQTTELQRTSLTAGLKFHVASRGRSLGKYAFIPNRVSPYVGAGAGVLIYKLDQFGDFADFETLDIFSDHFEEEGVTPTANVFAGGDIWIHSNIALNLEGRYNWAKGSLDSYSFEDFEKIDLQGWQLTAGISLRY